MNRYVLAAALALVAQAAAAEEITLKAITAFAEGTTYSRPFERFIQRVNETGKGLVHINYIGGPKAMPPFEVGNALKGGVVDIANATGAFYTNVMPEADAWKLLLHRGDGDPVDLEAVNVLKVVPNMPLINLPGRFPEF